MRFFFIVGIYEIDHHSSLGIFAGVAATGIASTLLLEETMDRTLEDLSREQQQGFIHGEKGACTMYISTF